MKLGSKPGSNPDFQREGGDLNSQKELLKDLIGKEKDALLPDHLKETLNEFLGKFLERGAKPGKVPGHWIKVDGEKVRRAFSEDVEQIASNIDNFNSTVSVPNSDRLDRVGLYGYNGGVLAYVNEFGEMFVGLDTEKNREGLEKHGYIRDRDFSEKNPDENVLIWVPVKPIDEFKDPEKQKLWEKFNKDRRYIVDVAQNVLDNIS